MTTPTEKAENIKMLKGYIKSAHARIGHAKQVRDHPSYYKETREEIVKQIELFQSRLDALDDMYARAEEIINEQFDLIEKWKADLVRAKHQREIEKLMELQRAINELTDD